MVEQIEQDEVRAVFLSYPEPVREKMLFLRKLVLDTAQSSDDIPNLNETLKWGEPSYLSRHGSTLRIHWKEAQPNQYAMYFHCQTTLVDTFKEIYRDTFRFDGNRAILFDMDSVIAEKELKHCIFLTLTYHKRKHLPLLGA